MFSNFSHFITNIMLYQFIVDYCYQYFYQFIVDYSIVVLLPLSTTTTSAVAVAESIIFLFNQANNIHHDWFQIANSNTITFIDNILAAVADVVADVVAGAGAVAVAVAWGAIATHISPTISRSNYLHNSAKRMRQKLWWQDEGGRKKNLRNCNNQ